MGSSSPRGINTSGRFLKYPAAACCLPRRCCWQRGARLPSAPAPCRSHHVEAAGTAARQLLALPTPGLCLCSGRAAAHFPFCAFCGLGFPEWPLSHPACGPVVSPQRCPGAALLSPVASHWSQEGHAGTAPRGALGPGPCLCWGQQGMPGTRCGDRVQALCGSGCGQGVWEPWLRALPPAAMLLGPGGRQGRAFLLGTPRPCAPCSCPAPRWVLPQPQGQALLVPCAPSDPKRVPVAVLGLEDAGDRDRDWDSAVPSAGTNGMSRRAVVLPWWGEGAEHVGTRAFGWGA